MLKIRAFSLLVARLYETVLGSGDYPFRMQPSRCLMAFAVCSCGAGGLPGVCLRCSFQYDCDAYTGVGVLQHMYDQGFGLLGHIASPRFHVLWAFRIFTWCQILGCFSVWARLWWLLEDSVCM